MVQEWGAKKGLAVLVTALVELFSRPRNQLEISIFGTLFHSAPLAKKVDFFLHR